MLARREVVVSAGSIGSPKLLLLSGVGPEEQLRHHKVGDREKDKLRETEKKKKEKERYSQLTF